MIEAAKTPRNKMLLRIGLATGIRVSSMEQLKKSDIDIETGKITLKNCKGGKTRIVYIKEQLKEYIQEYYSTLSVAQ